MMECIICGYAEGHNWTCPKNMAAVRETVLGGNELHPAGTRDMIDAISHTLAAAGYPVSDGLAQCVAAQETDVRVWMELAEQYKRERDAANQVLRSATAEHVSDPLWGGGLAPLSAHYRATAQIGALEDQLERAINAQTEAEFDLPVWCWDGVYDQPFGPDYGVVLQDECGPEQELPF